MKEHIDWDLVKSDYQETDLSIRKIADRHGVSHTAVRNRIKKESWNRFGDVENVQKMVLTKYEKVGKIAKRKINEIVEVLGNNYLPTYEPLIIVFATNYEMWFQMKNELDHVGIIHKTPKGAKSLSMEFRALKEIEKTLRELGADLGLSVGAGMKLGLSDKTDIEEDSLFNLDLSEYDDVEI